ncbi:MAG: phage P2 small terminase subunit gpM-like protein [Hyphomonadaceae bacterium]|nr:MAG: phage P2 small terminase subunit gpM-like protein [Hyphomonadaceae bacterium]
MAMSPAQRFKAMAQANLSAADVSGEQAAPRPETGEAATEYGLLMAELQQDLHEISALASQELKSVEKAVRAPKYDVHIDAAIAAMDENGKALQDEIFTRLMVWHFDIGNYDRALQMGEYVIKFGLQMPPKFERTPQAFITESLADLAINAQVTKIEFPLPPLQKCEQVMEGLDMPDQTRAKLHKALGYGFQNLADKIEKKEVETEVAGGLIAAKQEALRHFQRAFELDKFIGIKKEIERLQRQVPT